MAVERFSRRLNEITCDLSNQHTQNICLVKWCVMMGKAERINDLYTLNRYPILSKSKESSM